MLGCTSITLASSHLVGAMFSSHTQTMSPNFMSLVGVVHLLNLCTWLMFSTDHCCQKCWTCLWQRRHHRSREISVLVMEWSGVASISLPIGKWPGVNTSTPSSASRRGVSDLQLRHASACAKVVVSSSNVRCMFPMILLRWYFNPITRRFSHTTKMRCMLWNEVPLYVLVRAKSRDVTLRIRTVTKIVRLLGILGSPDKISLVITPNSCWLTASRFKIPKCGQEGCTALTTK